MSTAIATKQGLPARLIDEVSSLVHRETGIQLGPKQAAMVESRLSKRMLELGIADGEDYLGHLRSSGKGEITALVSLLTTHHTYFFREFTHFRFLESRGLKELVDSVRASGRRKLRVWSAACSRGQEAYSLAMFLQHHLAEIAPDFTFEILGTDVDPESVTIASNGVYSWDEIKEIPGQYLGKHWMRGTGDIEAYVRAKDSLRKSCRFSTGNLLELDRADHGKFDLIFCRNVFIYFDPDQIRAITRGLLKRLEPSGLLMLGLSESLRGLDLPVASLGHSIFRHPAAPVSQPAAKTVTQPAPEPAVAVLPAKPLRVLCVDDSPTVLALLKRILVAEHGFEVVGTAASGIEAKQALARLSPDLVTLDIHMPGQTGLEYLRENFGPSHPPVVMISSVSREDAGLAMQCLSLGARDYVEKPALSNLTLRADEIRAKLYCASRSGKGARREPAIEREFKRAPSIRDATNKVRVILAGAGDRDRIRQLLEGWQGEKRPPVLILLEGAENLIPALAPTLAVSGYGTPEHALPASGALVPGKCYLVEAQAGAKRLDAESLGKSLSIMAMGDVSSALALLLQRHRGQQVLITEQKPRPGSGLAALEKLATDRVPVTSFGYLSDEYLGKKDERR